MDSHSRSASPRDLTASRPQHRPPSPPPTTPPAFDNRAYQHDEDHNHNDSFTSQQQNGHTKDQPNGTQTKTPEAVNLELINLTPKNGSKKKDVEVDLNASNPYDEYFVPVNEHRKYMRGEKLYVTADKRGEKGGCKRPLCWTLFALVAAAVIALIVLAATGILFTNAPTPLDQFNSSSVSSARAFGGIGAHDHSDHEHDHSAHEQDQNSHEHDNIAHDLDHISHDLGREQDLVTHEQDLVTHEQDQVTRGLDQGTHAEDHVTNEQDQMPFHHVESTAVAEPSPKENAEMPTTQMKLDLPVSDESTEAAMYVPRTLEGELKIDNEEFIEELADPESEDFRNFNHNFGNALKRALFDRDTLENGNNKIYVEIITIRPGSLIVTYRIHWIPKISTEVTEDILTPNSLRMALDDYLQRNSRMISVYHVAEDKMSTRHVLDLCHLNKNDCEYGCSFEETSLDFMCICPRGQMIDISNAKKCMPILESNIGSAAKPIDITKQKGYRVLDIGTEGTITKQIPDEEKPKDNFDWKSSEEITVQTTTDAAPEFKHSHVFGNGSDQSSKHDPSADPKAKPESPAQPGLNVQVTPEPTAQTEPEPALQPQSEPSAKPEPTGKLESESSAEHELTGTPQPEPSIEPEPTPKSEPEPSAEPEPTAKPEPEPSTEPEPIAKPEFEPFTELEPTAKLETETSAETESINKLEAEPSAEAEPITKPEPEPSAEAEPRTKPEPEPSTEAELTAKPEPEPSTELEPTAKPEPLSKYQAPTFLDLSAEFEQTTDPEPKSEPSLQQIIGSQDSPIYKNKYSLETTAEPVPNTTQLSPELQTTHELGPEADLMKRNEMHGVTLEPEIKPLWEYKSVTERNTFFNEMQTKLKLTTKSALESEAATTTEHNKMSQETILLDHLYRKESKTTDEITTVGTILNENTSIEPEDIKPDIFSIYERLSKNENKTNDLKSDNQEPLNNIGNNINETTTTTLNYMEFINENIKFDDTKHSSQNVSLLPKTTTPALNSISTTTPFNSNEDISFDLITKQKENTEEITETQSKSKETESLFLNPTELVEEEHTTNTTSTESSFSTISEEAKQTYDKMETKNNSDANISIGDYVNIALSSFNKSDTVDFESNNRSGINNDELIMSEFEKTFNTALKETTQNITSTLAPIKENTTMLTELINFPEHVTPTEYSISKNYQPNKTDGIVEFLENHTKTTEVTTTTSTEKGTSEATEITFDAINEFFNRSSKSIEAGTHASRNETIETTTEPKVTTASSDWLSESVTEINYKELMLETKTDKLTTTDQPLIKIEEMINKGYTKDDFEPEYLNISPTKGPEREEPFYGMVHNDYDSEDFRVKRVNSVKENPILLVNNTFEVNKSSGAEINHTAPSTMKILVKNSENSIIITTTEKHSPESARNTTVISLEHEKLANLSSKTTNSSSQIISDQIESTTVSQFIYKSAEKARDEPAPVWEKEDEPVSVLQISTISQSNLSNVTESETSLISTQKINEEITTNNPLQDEIENGNSTQVSNLNVTIYEIPGHNHSFTTSKSTSQLTEYEDHETEMNPFLPEVENNKSLVKKLQEGHDLIDPASVNEKQNENAEEHSSHISEITKSETSTITEKALEGGTRTNEDESTFNELNNESYNSPEVDSNVPETNGKPENAQENGPVVTFLQDTDDLDVIKRVQTPEPTTISNTEEVTAETVVSKAFDEDSDYLSVVPIVEERREKTEALRKTYLDGGIQKLNDISDSPKKSDRRTLDASRLDSVINNEA